MDSRLLRSKRLVSGLALGVGLLAWGAPSEARAAGREGEMFANLAIGPAFALNGGGAYFNLELQGGYAFKENLYVTFTPAFGFASGNTAITLPLGVQYDIPITSVPNLYVYPRGSLGVGIFTGIGQAAFAIIPEVGVKYVIENKYNIFFEPVSLPIYIAGSPFPTTDYRLNFGGGLNF